MLITSALSPSARLKNPFSTPYSHPIAHSALPSFIPPLHRLSDISYYIYSLLGNPSSIRYLGHDWITNGDTGAIIEDIFLAHYRTAELDLPWPVLQFDVASEGGRALLAMPNSLAVAWMMVDHAAVLGRRRPTVNIFTDNGGVLLCMLWDLVPVVR